MALVPCPECQKEVSTQALACPQCAFPFPGKHGLSEDPKDQKLSTCPDCGFLISKQARLCPHCGIAKRDEQNPKTTKKITQVDEQPLQTTNGSLIEETWLCPHCSTPYTRKVKPQGGARSNPHEVPSALPLEKVLPHVPAEQNQAEEEPLALPLEKDSLSTEAAANQVEEAPLVLSLEKEWLPTEIAQSQTEEASSALPLEKDSAHAEIARARVQEEEPVLSGKKEWEYFETSSVSDRKSQDMGGLLPLRTRSPLWQDPSGNKEISSPSYPRHRKKSLVVGVTIFVLVAVLIALGAFWQFQGINPLEALVYWRM